jgi:hypothetical protein
LQYAHASRPFAELMDPIVPSYHSFLLSSVREVDDASRTAGKHGSKMSSHPSNVKICPPYSSTHAERCSSCYMLALSSFKDEAGIERHADALESHVSPVRNGRRARCNSTRSWTRSAYDMLLPTGIASTSQDFFVLVASPGEGQLRQAGERTESSHI